MTVTVREYRDEDHEQAGIVWASAFRQGQPYSPDSRLPGNEEDAEGFVAEKDGRIVGGFAIRYTSMICRGALLTCGGMCAVATDAAYRKHGIGKAMMEWSLKYMQEKGLGVSNLHAAHQIFYRKNGWECCGTPTRITCSIPLLNSFGFKTLLPIRRLSVDDWPQVSAAYEKFAYNYSGMAIRKSFRWGFALYGGGNPPQVFAAGDPVEAYAVMRMVPESLGSPYGERGRQVVAEFVWATPEGYESLLSTFAGVAINLSTVQWFEPFNGPFLSKYLTRGVEARVRHPSLFRVLDVPGSLTALPASGSGTFTLAVDDEILPSNRGPWRVSYSPEGVEVEPSDTAEVRMDIRHFAQALMGEPSFSDLLLNGLVSCTNTQAAQAAAALLSPKTTHVLEIF